MRFIKRYWNRLLIKLGIRQPKPFNMEDYLAVIQYDEEEMRKVTGISEEMLGKH